jgi:hypothetical protein
MRGFLVEKKATAYSPGCYPSTMGAGRLNFSVRDGKRWCPAAKVTFVLLMLLLCLDSCRQRKGAQVRTG